MSELFLETIQGEIPAKFPAGMPEETQPYGKPKSHIPALLPSFSNVGMGGKSWEFLEVTGSLGMPEFGGNLGMRDSVPQGAAPMEKLGMFLGSLCRSWDFWECWN